MEIYEQRDGRGITRHYIQDLESWSDFSVIVDKVVRSLPATLIRRADGPDSRFAIVETAGLRVIFVHDDMMGNCFFIEGEDPKDVAKRIAALF